MSFIVSSLRIGPCLVFGCAMLSGAAGCTLRPAAQVSGTVTFDGQLITSGSVILYCEDKQIVRGIIGPDGTYTIPNVPRGNVLVTVRAHTPIPPGFQLRQQLPPVVGGPISPTTRLGNHDSKMAIPDRYGVPEESGLSFKVDRAQVVYPIDLKP